MSFQHKIKVNRVTSINVEVQSAGVVLSVVLAGEGPDIDIAASALLTPQQATELVDALGKSLLYF
jgi:hypothetical protein